jgi:hypothetical protein
MIFTQLLICKCPSSSVPWANPRVNKPKEVPRIDAPIVKVISLSGFAMLLLNKDVKTVLGHHFIEEN